MRRQLVHYSKRVFCNIQNSAKDNGLKSFCDNAAAFPRNEYYVKHASDVSTWINIPNYDGVFADTLISDENGVRQLCYIKKGTIEKPHYHLGRYEWLVLSGKFRMMNPISGKTTILSRGDYYCNPAEIPHTHECLEDAVIFWIYSKSPDSQTLQ